MSIFYAVYNLHSGYIHNWLVAGPQAIPIPDLERFTRHQQVDSGITQPPVAPSLP